MTDLAIKTFRIKNFKAIQDSGTVQLGPLTVLIGNNGSGKSSFIEGLETYQTILKHGLDIAMKRWQGFEQVRNRTSYLPLPHDLKTSDEDENTIDPNPMAFELCRTMETATFCANLSVTQSPENETLIQNEQLLFNEQLIVERQTNNAFYFPELESFDFSAPASSEFSILSRANSALWAALSRYVKRIQTTTSSTMLIKWLKYINKNKRFWDSFDWQFMTLNSCLTGSSMQPKRTGREVQLNKDGTNIAKYLLNLRKQSQPAFNGILETLQQLLPYAKDLQIILSTELKRSVYLQLTEGKCQIAEWLLSTGTLRIVALLALLRHPNPPSLIVIEEIENGLDPRTLHLMLEEIHKVVNSGKSQVIVTTHSPYFLDLLRLEHIVLVERDDNGQPTFFQPDNNSSLAKWAKKFTPGKLYTMGKLSRQTGV